MRKIQQTKKGILTVLAGTALLIAAVMETTGFTEGQMHKAATDRLQRRKQGKSWRRKRMQ